VTTRVMLVSPAGGAGLREARFGSDEVPDVSALSGSAGWLPQVEQCWRGPSRRCAATADALRLTSRTEQRLADLDVGRWHGRTLDEVAAEEPAAVGAWLRDPGGAPHGGESVTALVRRVGEWLDGLADGRVVAVADPAVVRAALVHALGVPAEAFWRLDVAPLTVTELSGRLGRWNLRCGRPLR